MAYKFEIKGNAVVVTDTVTSEVLIAQPAKNTWFEEQKLDLGYVSIYGMSGTDQDNINRYKYDNNRGFALSDCQDENGTPFNAQSFREWCYNNLASFSSGGSTSLSTSIGFIDYNDSSTSTTPITLIQDTWTDVPNDGLGAFTNKGYSPVNELLDGSTGYLDFSELTLGSDLLIRIDFEVTPQTNNALLESRYVLGTAPNDYALPIRSRRLDSGSGTPYSSEKGAFYIYMGDTNTLTGVGKLQVKLSSNGTLKNNGVAIKIYKK
ncbi:MAG: hypothetical protein ACTSQA_08235 [Candidatus Heimdallarchaeaceae archaeon]